MNIPFFTNTLDLLRRKLPATFSTFFIPSDSGIEFNTSRLFLVHWVNWNIIFSVKAWSSAERSMHHPRWKHLGEIIHIKWVMDRFYCQRLGELVAQKMWACILHSIIFWSKSLQGHHKIQQNLTTLHVAWPDKPCTASRPWNHHVPTESGPRYQWQYYCNLALKAAGALMRCLQIW